MLKYPINIANILWFYKVISWFLQHMMHEKQIIFGVFHNSYCLIQPREAVKFLEWPNFSWIYFGICFKICYTPDATLFFLSLVTSLVLSFSSHFRALFMLEVGRKYGRSTKGMRGLTSGSKYQFPQSISFREQHLFFTWSIYDQNMLLSWIIDYYYSMQYVPQQMRVQFNLDVYST